MSNGNEDRLVNIESALAHVDQLTESLNETMVEQAKSIRRLTQQMDQLADRMAAEDMKAANITASDALHSSIFPSRGPESKITFPIFGKRRG